MSRHPRHLHYYLYFLDIIALAGTAICFHFLLAGTGELGILFGRYGLAILAAILAFSLFGFASGFYDWRKYRQHLRQPYITFGGVLFAFGCLLLIAFAFKITSDFSRLWLGTWILSFTSYILISRVVLTWYLAKPTVAAELRRRAVIIGTGEHGQAIWNHMSRFDDHGIELIGFLDDQLTQPPSATTDQRVLGKIDDIKALICNRGLDLVIIALPRNNPERIEAVIDKLSTWSLDVYIAPDAVGLRYADRPKFRINGMNVLSVRDRPISEWSAVVKRIEDLCIAITALILLSPLMAIVAIVIKLESKGSVFFLQERYGFNNNLIKVFKFRSMYTEQQDSDCSQQTTKADPRVTRFGRFIRATSIDELPQLFNVVYGNMSIVGPRPHATKTKAGNRLFEDVVTNYASRHRVKPGITGWAQCNGWRGETDTCEKIQKRVEHDLYYIENWTIFLDLLIIYKTARLLLKKDTNAY